MMNYYIIKVIDDAGNLCGPVIAYAENEEAITPQLRVLYGDNAHFDFALQDKENAIANFGEMKPNSTLTHTTWVWDSDQKLAYRPL